MSQDEIVVVKKRSWNIFVVFLVYFLLIVGLMYVSQTPITAFFNRWIVEYKDGRQRDREATVAFTPQLSTIRVHDFVLTEEGWWLIEASEAENGTFAFMPCNGCTIVSGYMPSQFVWHIRKIVHQSDPEYAIAAQQFVLNIKPYIPPKR